MLIANKTVTKEKQKQFREYIHNFISIVISDTLIFAVGTLHQYTFTTM